MQIGLVLPMNDADAPGGSTWPRIRSVVRHAEAVGLDSAWVYDHLIFRFPDRPESGILEPWTLLSAVAAVTERLTLGTIVLGTAFRSPGLLAKMAATLDEVAAGRLVLGLGTGWHEPEYRAFGYPFDHRAGRFEEALSVMLPLLRGERVTVHGRWHDAEDAVLLPPPPPRPAGRPPRIPVLIAAKGERVLRLTARHADAWNTAWYGVPEPRFEERRADLLRACEIEGRDPATLEVTVGLTLDAGGDPGRPGAPAALPADADAIARALDAWRALGVAHVQVDVRPADEATIDVLAAGARLHRAG